MKTIESLDGTYIQYDSDGDECFETLLLKQKSEHENTFYCYDWKIRNYKSVIEN